MAVCRVSVVDRDLGHHPVDRDGARVVRDDEGPPGLGDVLDPTHLDPEPLLVDRTQEGQPDAVGEVGVEAELVDLEVTRRPTTEVGQRAGHLLLGLVGG